MAFEYPPPATVFIDDQTPANKQRSLSPDDNDDPSARMSMKKERVAEILERNAESAIRSWMSKVERNEELSGVSLSYQERTGYLLLLLSDLVCRLRLAPDAQPPISPRR